MVIVDSTVWIQYLRKPDTRVGQEFQKLMESDELAVVGMVIAEVLQGAHGEKEFAQLFSWFDSFPYLDASKNTWEMVGKIAMELRVRGKLTPMSDLIIAAIALENNCQVFTLDDHFGRIPGLKLHKA